MASNPELERLLARIGINIVCTKVSGVFRSSTCFACPDRFSAPLWALKCLSPVSPCQADKNLCRSEFNWLDILLRELFERQLFLIDASKCVLSYTNQRVRLAILEYYYSFRLNESHLPLILGRKEGK